MTTINWWVALLRWIYCLQCFILHKYQSKERQTVSSGIICEEFRKKEDKEETSAGNDLHLLKPLTLMHHRLFSNTARETDRQTDSERGKEKVEGLGERMNQRQKWQHSSSLMMDVQTLHTHLYFPPRKHKRTLFMHTHSVELQLGPFGNGSYCNSYCNPSFHFQHWCEGGSIANIYIYCSFIASFVFQVNCI